MSKKDYVHVIRLPTGSTIVTKWLSEFDLPLIATCLGYQILAIDKGDDHVPKNRLAREINYIKPPDFSLPEYRNTIYAVLADLDLSIYVTTNYDHFMEAALGSRGKQPTSDFCRWNDELKRTYKHITDILQTDHEPTPTNPLVFHLHGDTN